MMNSFIRTIAALVLITHGLIHFMGTIVYMKLGEIPGFNYKTTLLNGRWDLGVFGGAIGAAFFPILAWDRLPLILLKIIYRADR
jgi:hypothetical protein